MANVEIVESRLNPSKVRKRKGSVQIVADGIGGTIISKRQNSKRNQITSRTKVLYQNRYALSLDYLCW
jgi:hypothetical protein